jgi:hypothetical protein
MVDRECLAEMRRYPDELRNEIAEREARLEADPQAAHDALMETLQTRSAPVIIHKVTQNAPTFSNATSSDDDQAITDDDMVEAVMTLQSAVLDLQRDRDQMAQRIALLEARFETFMALVGGADAGRAKAARKRSNGQQLLEAPTDRHPS